MTKVETVYSLYEPVSFVNDDDPLLYATVDTENEAIKLKGTTFRDGVLVKETVMWDRKSGDCHVISSNVLPIAQELNAGK